MAPTMKWLDVKHKEYEANVLKWEYTRDHYSGDVLSEEKIRNYLIRRTQGETDKAYLERLRIADYTPHFATIVDTLAGMLFAVESRADRRWANEDNTAGLGSVKTEGTPAHRLWEDADGMGTSWSTIWKSLAVDLIALHRAWVLIDTNEFGMPVVKLVSPCDVPNWIPSSNGPIQVLLKENTDYRTSLMDDYDTNGGTFLEFNLQGWVRWQRNKDGSATALDTGAYSYVDRNGQPTLPIFPIQLPLRRMVGYMLARKANAIFNHESARDFLLRVANFPRLNIMGSEATYKKVVEALKRGDNALQNDPQATAPHNYIAPDVGPATTAGDVIQKKVDAFYITGFQSYSDAAMQRTATEVKQDVAAGVGAFLQMLKAAVDDAENRAGYLLEQAYYSKSPERWGAFHVERIEDYAPFDLNQMVERLRTRYFAGQPVPLGKKAQIQVAKKIAEWDGIEIDVNELDSSIDLQNLKQSLGLFQSLPIPAEGKAEMAIRLLEVLGLLKPEQRIQMADGTEMDRRKSLMAMAFELSSAQEQNELNQQRFPFPTGG